MILNSETHQCERKKKKKKKITKPRERKKKGQKLRLTSDRGTQYVVLITKMLLKTEFGN